MTLKNITEPEQATILAALHYYQESGLADDPSKRSDEIHDIATNGDALMASLDGAGIDELCEKLNFLDTTSEPDGSKVMFAERVLNILEQHAEHNADTTAEIVNAAIDLGLAETSDEAVVFISTQLIGKSTT